MPGRLIAIEGIDGAGKGTQAKRLCDRLAAAGRTVALLSFPRYSETRFGGFVGEYLNGRFGSLDGVHPLLASLLFAGDRFESRPVLLTALEAHDFVVCDRYVASNVAHQAAKRVGDERAELIRRIEAIEFEVLSLPRPDLTVVFDLSVENARRLIAKKAARSYTDRTEDLHESDGRYLHAVREVYRTLAATEPNWAAVPVERDDAVRPVEDVAEETWRAVAARFAIV